MSNNQNEDLYLQSYPFTTAAAIIGSVDRKVFLTLYDGRTILGVLRTFDQFGNLVIHDGIERLYFPESKEYSESLQPEIYFLRGENLVMMGEIDIDGEDETLLGWKRIDWDLGSKKWIDSSKKTKLINENNDLIKKGKGLDSGKFFLF
ncbi:Lsm1 protein [Martiniozyma asiatica (nom. inval.)]|nr:Lsm1 protein [Martiniozyma asiatica]